MYFRLKLQSKLSIDACTAKKYCTENWKKVFLDRKLRGLSPNFYNYIYSSDLCIPTIGLPIWLQQNSQTDPGNI
jgi:hypothetical protein